MKQFIIAGIVGLATTCFCMADTKDDVKNAAKQLAGKDNYSWTQTTKNEGGGGGFGGRGGFPSEGKINKDGLAYVVSKFTNQDGDEMIFERAMKGEKTAVKGQDGTWQAVGAPGQGGGGRGGRGGGGFMGGARNPVATAENLVSKVSELKTSEPGVFAGDLTEEGAKSLLTFGGRGGQNAPQVAGAKGSAKFWIKDGILAKIEYKVQGKVTFNDQEMDRNTTTTIEIKNVGTTKVEVPKEAQDELNKN